MKKVALSLAVVAMLSLVGCSASVEAPATETPAVDETTVVVPEAPATETPAVVETAPAVK
ncbi:hypothetical protein M0P48_00375 [Candidatus Gracilibacteria bacterium]|nr:hypothetical protein [Candidatus Gracilibacteria bacterium]